MSGQVQGNKYIEYADEGTTNPPFFAFHEFLDAHKPDLPNPELPISTQRLNKRSRVHVQCEELLWVWLLCVFMQHWPKWRWHACRDAVPLP